MLKINPFFSIIIPTLNEENYLPKLLKCIAKQTYKDFEVIVADGKSDDKTTKAAEKFFGDIAFLEIITSSKRNVSFQRNLGAKKSQGKFIAFIDADSKIPPDFLKRIHSYLLHHQDKFLTTWLEGDSKAKIDHLMMLLTNLGMELGKNLGKPFACGANLIVNREIFNKIGGFREDLKLSEDHDFAIRAKKHGFEITVLKEPKMTYSLRRFRREGRLKIIRNYTRATIHLLLKGPITQELFDYPMGGKVAAKKSKYKSKIIKLNRYIKELKNGDYIYKQITNLFS